MKQVIRRGIREIIVDEVPAPALARHHVLIEPAFSLISSGTESASIHQEGAFLTVAEHPEHVHKILKAFKEHGLVRTFAEVKAKFSEYSILGYAGAGVVVEKHATVTDLGLGDRVAYGGEGTGHGEYVLAGRNYVVRIPDSVSFRSASFTTLGSIALNAVRAGKIELGDTIVVQGLGVVGQLISQLVQLQGGVVIGVDLREDRLNLAQQLGAQYVGHPEVATQVVNARTNGRGADCVIIAAASKSSVPARQAVEFCRERGRIVVVGAVDMSFPWEQMYLKEVQIFMARAYGAGCYDLTYEKEGRDYPVAQVRWTANRNMEEFLRLVKSGRVQVEPLISHEFLLKQAPQAYQTILDPVSSSLGVVLRYPRAEKEQNGVEVSRPCRKSVITPQAFEEKSSRAQGEEFEVALVGAGNLARWVHLPILKRIPGVHLRAIYSTNGVRSKSYGLRFGAAYCVTDYDEVLNDPAVNVVVIASRNGEHCSQALRALRAGKHVFLEKPMAITEDECRLLYREAELSNRTLTIGFNRRFAPCYTEAKKCLSRRTGPAVISARINSPGIAGSHWMADTSIGGALVGEGCHFVDLMYWLLESEPIRVSAYSFPRGLRDPIGENNIVASFLYADGSIANLTYCTVGSKSGGGEQLEAFAPGLMLSTCDFRHFKAVGSERRSKNFWFPAKGYLTQMQSFFDAIRKGRAPEVTALDGARATLCCLRMLDSARHAEPRQIKLGEVLVEDHPRSFSSGEMATQ